jgi:hypothetical protein
MAIGPIDYYGMQPHEDLTTEFLRSAQLGAGLRQMFDQRAAQEAAQQQAAQYQADAAAFQQNPTAQGALALSLKYPDQAKPITDAFGAYTGDQQKVELRDAATLTNLLHADRPDLAMQEIDDRIEAAKNSGLPTNQLEALKSVIQKDPKAALAHSLTIMAALPGGKDVLANLQGINKDARDQSESDVKVAGGQLDNEQKTNAAIGSVFGSLIGKNASADQVKNAAGSLYANNVISANRRDALIAGIPADPKAIDGYLKQVQAAGMKPDDQMKFTTPTADAQLSAATQRRGQDITAGTAAARLAFDREQAKDEPAAPVGTPGLQGQQYLSTLDKPTADQVKALAEGRLGFPVGKALQSPYWQKMITAVAQYDPTFDAVNYNARAKTRNDFVAGKSAENIKAINTAIAHMGQLNDQLTALDNSSYPAVNSAKNWLATHVGGTDRQGKLAAADATAEGVAGEMAKVFRSTGMSEKEIDAWREKFTGSITPAQQQGTMKSAMHMLRGRMEAIEDQYRTGMGTTAAPLRILTPEAQTIFDKLLGEKHGNSKGDAPAAAADHPADISALLSKYGKK